MTVHSAHPPGFAHQFEDMEQQREADSLGMWVFLLTEIMFFGGLFATYIIYRALYLPAFEIGSHQLEVKFGALNTAVLIGSSLTMALAIHSAQVGKRKAQVGFLITTMILGAAFLAIKFNLNGTTITSSIWFPASTLQSGAIGARPASMCPCSSVFISL